jgi:hypothetical protein
MGDVGQQRHTPVELTTNPPVVGHAESQRGSGAHRPAPGAAAAAMPAPASSQFARGRVRITFP